ncbi:MAG TPA: hypothetical protein VH417_05955 [Vicinamibacterales bacterium]|jgi:hypothetical protein
MRWSLRRSTILALAFVAIASGQALDLAAQTAVACSRVWLGHEAEFERALADNRASNFEQLPIGVTKPVRGSLDPPTPAARFTWKPLKPGYHRGYRESYTAEIAAYELDRLLGLGMVPPAVERTVDGDKGAAIYWIENMKPWETLHGPRGPEPEWSRQLSRMKMFDLLIANIDRNKGNLGYDADWHLFLIDHSRALTDKKDLKGLAQPAYIDRMLWEKMSALTLDSLKAALGELVSDDDLEALLVRRDKMATAIAGMVKKRGQSVFF